MRLRFADGTSARVYRETVVDRGPTEDPCVLVVEFRLRAVRGRGHAAFRWESLLNTPLFAGFPGFVSKLWLAHDERGRYRGLYEWDGPRLAENYARALWRVLALVSVPGSIHYVVLPGLRRDELLDRPQVLAGTAAGCGGLVAPGRSRGERGTADILVAGAGPAGLALALQAHDHGADVRVIDRRPEAARPSRALILHPRTLEVLRPLGVTQALLARADIAPTADLQLGSRVVRVTLADLALPDTAFPHLSLIRQMDVEGCSPQALADRGVRGGARHRAGRGARRPRRRAGGPAVAGHGRGDPGSASWPAATARPAPCAPRPASGGPGGRTRWRSCWPTPNWTAISPATPPRSWPGGGGWCSPFRLGERATWRLLATRPAGADQLPSGQLGAPGPGGRAPGAAGRGGPGRADRRPGVVLAGRVAAPRSRPVPPGPAVSWPGTLPMPTPRPPARG